MSEIQTGLDELDRELDGGFTKGTVGALISPPGIQTSVILSNLASNQRTLFLSPILSSTIMEDMFPDESLRTNHIITKSIASDSDKNHYQKILESVNDIKGGSDVLVLIHGLRTIEQDVPRSKYVQFLNSLRQKMVEKDGVTLFVGTDCSGDSPCRDMTLTVSDFVMKVDVNMDDDEMQTRLWVPKRRTGAALTEAITVNLTDQFTIDTSRDIA